MIHGMISMPETLPDDPILLKQLLLSASVQMSEKDGQIERLREQNALLIQRLFGRKSEQSSDPDSPQLEIFNEAESLAEAAPEAPEAPADAVEKDAVALELGLVAAGHEVIVETKAGPHPSGVDRLLWAAGHRPASLSKYGTGLAALRGGVAEGEREDPAIASHTKL